MRLEGQTCVVTGGASGIGLAIAEAFSSEGATVAILDFNMEAARTAAATLAGGFAVRCDVGDAGKVDLAFDEVKKRTGRLDVLVNNAGIVGAEEYRRVQKTRELQITQAAAGEPLTPLRATVSLTDEQWDAMIRTHLTGTFNCTRAAIRSMETEGSGCIINMSSMTGIDGGVGNPHYAAAKAGILGFTRAVAKEVIRQGIRVNAVAPGFVDTPLRDSIMPAIRRAQIAATPIGRAASAAEIAATVVFLASPEGSYYVGETFSPNGGYLTV